TSGALTFAPGTTTQTITVPVVGDTLDELSEQFTVNLSNATNATIALAQGVGTITNDDTAPSLAIGDATVTEGNAGVTNAVFAVSRRAASGRQIVMQYAPADGTATAGLDYTAASGTLTFAPGVTAQQITVAVLGETLFEANETFFLNLTTASN